MKEIKSEVKVAKEVAGQEFERFADLMDLDVDPAHLDDEDKKALELQKSRIIAAIMAGALVISEDGEPTYTPQRSADKTPITFREPTGANLMAMDRKKKNEDIGKLYALMGEIAKVHSNTFAQMKMSDLKVCQAVVTLFLG